MCGQDMRLDPEVGAVPCRAQSCYPVGKGAWVLGGLCTTHLKTRKLDSMSTKMTPFSDTLQFLPLTISIASSGLFQGSLADTVAIILLLLALPV